MSETTAVIAAIRTILSTTTQVATLDHILSDAAALVAAQDGPFGAYRVIWSSFNRCSYVLRQGRQVAVLEEYQEGWRIFRATLSEGETGREARKASLRAKEAAYQAARAWALAAIRAGRTLMGNNGQLGGCVGTPHGDVSVRGLVKTLKADGFAPRLWVEDTYEGAALALSARALPAEPAPLPRPDWTASGRQERGHRVARGRATSRAFRAKEREALLG